MGLMIFKDNEHLNFSTWTRPKCVNVMVDWWRECFINILLMVSASFLRCYATWSRCCPIPPWRLIRLFMVWGDWVKEDYVGPFGSAVLPASSPADTEPIPPMLIGSVLPLILDWVRLLCWHKQNPVFFVKQHPVERLLNTMFFILLPSPSHSGKLSRKQLFCPKKVRNVLLSDKNNSLYKTKVGQ